MRHNRLYRLFVFFPLFVFSNGYGQSAQQVDNIVAFAKLYGYIRYFHPSDEASKIDWDRFAVYGSAHVQNCKTADELKDSLKMLFSPIAPTLKIFKLNAPEQFDITMLTPPGVNDYHVIAWQHLGVNTNNTEGRAKSANNVYKSRRTNRPVDSGLLFNDYSKVGEYIQKVIGNDLKIISPLALYGSREQTYPAAETEKFDRLRKSIANLADSQLTGNNLQTRLGDLIITWNIFQHFFPYFEFAKTDWEQDFKESISKAFSDKTDLDFHKTLQVLTAKLRDGHVAVTFRGSPFPYFPMYWWSWIENKLVITHVGEPRLPLSKGDVVLKVNGQEAKDYFDSFKQYISSATPGPLLARTEFMSLMGEAGTKLQLTVLKADNSVAEVEIMRMRGISGVWLTLPRPDTIKRLSSSMMYVNLDVASIEEIEKAMPELQKMKVIICDLRGYPNNNHRFIQYLLKDNDTSSQWMQVPQIIYPDQERIAGYRKVGWQMPKLSPHLKAKVIFIISGRAISYAESFLSFIEHYKLATIIGEPTAGTNGNVNPFTLPGGYLISWTGMYVQKHNGTPLHGVGIIPDIYVKRTIKGIREGRDEFLEKAIEVGEKMVRKNAGD